jgi:hypothetical protein
MLVDACQRFYRCDRCAVLLRGEGLELLGQHVSGVLGQDDHARAQQGSDHGPC